MGDAMPFCKEQTRWMHTVLTSNLDDDYYITYVKGIWCFRVLWPESHIGLSVATPPDGNQHHEKFGIVYETAMFDIDANAGNGKLVYDDDANYDDVRRFSDISDVEAEIRRMRRYTTERPDKYPPSHTLLAMIQLAVAPVPPVPPVGVAPPQHEEVEEQRDAC